MKKEDLKYLLDLRKELYLGAPSIGELAELIKQQPFLLGQWALRARKARKSMHEAELEFIAYQAKAINEQEFKSEAAKQNFIKYTLPLDKEYVKLKQRLDRTTELYEFCKTMLQIHVQRASLLKALLEIDKELLISEDNLSKAELLKILDGPWKED